MRSRLRRLEPIARHAALTVGAVLGLICILVTLLAVVAQVRPMVFRSGSMAPAIDTGALALARRVDARDLEVGDVASVITDTGHRVSHRIVSVEHHHGTALLRLKGDGNRVPDARPYVVDHADVVILSVPDLGYAVGWLGSPVGLFVLGLYAAFFLSMLLRGAPDRSPRQPPPGRRRSQGPPSSPGSRHRRSRRTAPPRRRAGAHVRPARALARSLPVVAGVVLAGTLVVQTVGPAFAAWIDLGRVEGTTQTAYAVPAPDGSSCAASLDGGDGVVVLTWPATAATLPELAYDAHVAGLTTSTWAVAAAGGQQQLTVRYDTGDAGDQGRTVTVTATGHLVGTPSWASAATTWSFTTGTAGQAPTCA